VLWCYGFSSGEFLRLSWRSLLNTITIADLNTNINFHDGYEDALTLTLSEDLSIPFQKPISADLKAKARESRMAVIALNGLPPISDPDYPSGSTGYADRATFVSRSI